MTSKPRAWSTLRELPGYLRAFRAYLGGRMYVLFALNLFTALTEGIGIVMLLPLLQALSEGRAAESTRASALLNAALRWLGLDSVVAILVMIGLVFLLKGLVSYGAQAYAGYLRSRLMQQLMSRLFDSYSRMDYRYYATRDTGYFVNVMSSQVPGFYTAFNAVASLFAGLIMSVSYFGFAMLVAWRFGMMALAVGVTMLLLFRWLNRIVREISHHAAHEAAHFSKLLIQTLQAFKYLAATGQTGPLAKSVIGSIDRMTGYQRRQQMADALTGSVREPLSVLFIIGIVLVQVTVLHQPLEPIMVSILLFHRGLQAILGLQGSWQSALNYSGCIDMVRDEFAAQATHREPDGTREIGPLAREIALRDVSFAYAADGRSVLRNVTLTIPACRTVAVVGESGAGKSTLIDMLSLLLKPTGGELRIDGVDAAEVRLASWRRQIGYVSQETVVFDDTVANNICLWSGDPSADAALMARVRDAARRAHIDHFVETLSDGYQTVVGDRGIRLSGGQRQRLFIARELFKAPRLLILDEATSALDSESERFIQQSIDELHGQLTVVIIAHRLSTIRDADEIFVLDNGELVERGSYQALRERKGSRFEKMVALQNL